MVDVMYPSMFMLVELYADFISFLLLGVMANNIRLNEMQSHCLKLIKGNLFHLFLFTLTFGSTTQLGRGKKKVR